MTVRELVNRISLLDMVKQLGDRLTVGQRTLLLRQSWFESKSPSQLTIHMFFSHSR